MKHRAAPRGGASGREAARARGDERPVRGRYRERAEAHAHGNFHPDTGPRGEWCYGRRPVLELLRAARRHVYELRLMSDKVRSSPELSEIVDRSQRAGVPMRNVSRKELDTELGAVNHQGVALRAGSYPYGGFDQTLHRVREDPAALVLLLDHIEDPQNLGSVLRTAEAAGVTAVMLPQNRAAAVTAAVVRASAGASEHLLVVRVVNLVRAMEALKGAGLWITGLAMDASAILPSDVDFTGRVGLVVGAEGEGLHRLVKAHCDTLLHVPMRGRVASLNAGVACGMALYEVLRQRGLDAQVDPNTANAIRRGT